VAQQIQPFEVEIPESLRPHAGIIPIFGRLRPETGFDQHCVAALAVQFVKSQHGEQKGDDLLALHPTVSLQWNAAKSSALVAGRLGMPKLACLADAGGYGGQDQFMAHRAPASIGMVSRRGPA
jgi:hypothetical protein